MSRQPPSRRLRRRSSVTMAASQLTQGRLFSSGSPAIMPLLMSSPIGFHADFSQEALEPLVKEFSHVNFSAGTPIPRSAICFIASGSVRVTVKNRIDNSERFVDKHAGNWIFDPSAVSQAELRADNYAWAYDIEPDIDDRGAYARFTPFSSPEGRDSRMTAASSRPSMVCAHHAVTLTVVMRSSTFTAALVKLLDPCPVWKCTGGALLLPTALDTSLPLAAAETFIRSKAARARYSTCTQDAE